MLFMNYVICLHIPSTQDEFILHTDALGNTLIRVSRLHNSFWKDLAGFSSENGPHTATYVKLENTFHWNDK